MHANGAVFTVDLTMDEVRRLSKEKSNDFEQELKGAAKTLCSALKEFNCNQRPGSITANSAVSVPRDFDPRFSCKWKRYIYYISCGHQNRRSPFIARFAWQIDQCLDYESMSSAVRLLNGTHNFQWLSVVEEGELRSPIRTLGLKLERMEGSIFQKDGTTMLKVSGQCDFFLYNMMRRIVGALVSIGKKQTTLSALESCLKSHDEDRQPASKAAIPPSLLTTSPANGLCLDHVEYGIEV